MPQSTTPASLPFLVVRSLSWGPRGQAILKKISFTADRGQHLAIVGRNGSGKSSLLRCLYRAYRPTAGSISLNGQDIRTFPGKKFAQRVATVLQETPADFGLTVREIVALGRLPYRSSPLRHNTQDDTPVEMALETLDIAHLAHRAFATLSGGEKQRVSIARALAQTPELIILDEPTNHLDIRHRLELATLLKSLPITVIATVHDLDLAATFSDEILILSNGTLIARKHPLDINPDLVREAFDVDVNITLAANGDTPRFFYSLPSFLPSAS